MPLPDKLEQRLGASFMQGRAEQARRDLVQCPPINPQLLAHLRMMFSDPGREAKPTNPMLGQLLTIQYGVEKVLNYMEKMYDAQSEAARKANEI